MVLKFSNRNSHSFDSLSSSHFSHLILSRSGQTSSWKTDKMKKEKVLSYTFFIIILTSLNYHIWINELKAIAKKARIWQFVDLDTDLKSSQSSVSSQASDYKINDSSASSLKELFVEQKKEYKANNIEYDMLDKQFKRITQRLRTVNNVIRTSVLQYISSNELRSSTRKIIQLLAVRYKLDQSKIIEQIHEQWRDLKSSLTKDKIESWIVEWKNLQLQIISLNLAETFEDDVIFVNEFLRVDRRWASTFCDTWKNQQCHEPVPTTWYD